MRDDDEGAVGRAERVDAVGDSTQRVDVEARVRLVEDRQRGFEHGQLEDLVAFLFAAGEPLVDRAFLQARIEIHQRGFLARELQQPGGVERLQAPVLADRIDGLLQEVHHAHSRQFNRVLERHEHAFAGAFVHLHVQQIVAPIPHRAAVHAIVRTARQHRRQRALARAIRPHDSVYFARVNRQIDPLQDRHVLDRGFEIFYLQQWCHSFCVVLVG